jgi:poly-gamma-glutamate capsule biosynthesis protein CapA/YwtB (metallophosphatase superfamily)
MRAVSAGLVCCGLLVACSDRPDRATSTSTFRPGPATAGSSTIPTTPAESTVATTTSTTLVPPVQTVRVDVVDEDGRPVDTAELTLTGSADSQRGPTIQLSVDQPVAGVVRAEGYLPEPVVIDPSTTSSVVQLWRRQAADGSLRTSMHFGGDVMLGRRYQARDVRSDTPLVYNDDQARGVVSSIAPLMAAADTSMVNLETVVGDLADGTAYPGKRFLLQSPPTALAALDEMGIDLVTLGNNHANDWQDAGVVSTLQYLDSAAMPYVGAGLSIDDAQRGRVVGEPVKVGVVSATTVNGDFVNDNLPRAEEPVPENLPEADLWQYTEVRFGYGSPGDAAYVPTAMRRPGELWATFVAVESRIGQSGVADLWKAMTALDVAPQLQDWVARRGHGGAAAFDRDAVAAEIQRMRADGAVLVVVQLHGGFQFSDVPSDFLVRTTRTAVDLGADLVIAHHPHVLQGFDWYRGKLIAYSLGNFVFDQDFLSTFPSVLVRTVFEGNRLIEAKAIPVVIDRYRPVPLSGAGAQQVLGVLDARSALPAFSERAPDSQIISVFDDRRGDTASVDVRSGLITAGRESRATPIATDSSGAGWLQTCAVAEVRPDVEYGVDVMQWGAVDDVTADGASSGTLHWNSPAGASSVVRADGGRSLVLQSSLTDDVTVRPIGRASVPRHRLFGSDGGPLDGQARYELRLEARLTGVPDGGQLPFARVVTYDVRDTDPTVEPDSLQLSDQRLELPAIDEAWTDISIEVSDVLDKETDGIRPDSVLVFFTVPTGGARLEIDNVQLIEWRRFDDAVSGASLPADAVAGEPNSQLELALSGCTS